MTVNLQTGVILVDTDAGKRVHPSVFWSEVSRVGFVPVAMELWATGSFDADSFAVDGGRWPLVNRGPAEGSRRRAHFRVVDGSEDPPRVEILD